MFFYGHLLNQVVFPTWPIHILPNISSSKGNQTMKIDQLIECNMRNIFLEKSYSKCCVETSPKPFSKNLKIDHISGSMVSSFIQFVFNILIAIEI